MVFKILFLSSARLVLAARTITRELTVTEGINYAQCRQSASVIGFTLLLFMSINNSVVAKIPQIDGS